MIRYTTIDTIYDRNSKKLFPLQDIIIVRPQETVLPQSVKSMSLSHIPLPQAPDQDQGQNQEKDQNQDHENNDRGA